jgi:hypothetical protein
MTPTLTRSEANSVAIKFLNALATPKIKSCAIRNYLGEELQGFSVHDAVEKAPQDKLAGFLTVTEETVITIID